MRNIDNYYQILGVDILASVDDIKRAYRKLMLKHHPDVTYNPIGVEKFEKVVRAYKVLSNTIKREEYNRTYNIVSFSSKRIKKAKETKEIKVKKSSKVEKRFRFKDKIHFRFFNRSKENNNELVDHFFSVSKEILKLEPSSLKEQLNQSTNKYVRAEALKALVVLHGKQCYKLIEKAFGDQSKEVKEVAIRSIEKLQIRQAINYLSNLYQISGPDLRKAIVTAMGSLQISKGNEHLVQFCYDSNEKVRLEAVRTIKKYKLYSYIHRIKGLTYDKNPEIQHIIKSMLKAEEKASRYAS